MFKEKSKRNLLIFILTGASLIILLLMAVLNLYTDPIKLTDNIPRAVLVKEIKEVKRSGGVYSSADLLRWWSNSAAFRDMVKDSQKGTILPEKFDRMIRISAGEFSASSEDLKIAREFLEKKRLLSQQLEYELDQNSITPEMVNVMFQYDRKQRLATYNISIIQSAGSKYLLTSAEQITEQDWIKAQRAVLGDDDLYEKYLEASTKGDKDIAAKYRDRLSDRLRTRLRDQDGVIILENAIAEQVGDLAIQAGWDNPTGPMATRFGRLK